MNSSHLIPIERLEFDIALQAFARDGFLKLAFESKHLVSAPGRNAIRKRIRTAGYRNDYAHPIRQAPARAGQDDILSSSVCRTQPNQWIGSVHARRQDAIVHLNFDARCRGADLMCSKN